MALSNHMLYVNDFAEDNSSYSRLATGLKALTQKQGHFHKLLQIFHFVYRLLSGLFEKKKISPTKTD